MASTTEDVSAYVDLLTASLDDETLAQSDIKYIVHHIGCEDFEDAKRRCLLRMQEHGDDVISWAFYGLALMLQAQVKDAGEAIQRAAELDPENPLVLNIMGDFLCSAGREQLGEEAYWHSLKLDETQAHPRKMLCLNFMTRGEHKQCLDLILPVVRSNPEDAASWDMLRITLGLMGALDYAQELAETLTKELVNHHCAWRFKAHIHLANRDYTKAEQAAKRAIQLAQEDGENWNMLGTILNMTRKHKAAVKCQRKAVKLAPKNGLFWTSLGLALLKEGKLDECQRVISKAVKLDPEAAMELLQHMRQTT